ncbi:TonB-dependent receptor [Paraflavitalea sp. CAU 1676]|uniref:TonB-dependent receptor plug domain-containing protein n=1 Tax=Paraflavitalea sp. CAU 1676 TaxID=3032598 RepID=UPI0023DAC087|nr:TonB-dependent receptor [Paraflavitalea sp. CAU 1676]MDF2187148.1 TonB-dependent receptor [Paraflavitalea sp. CAU 1676]
MTVRNYGSTPFVVCAMVLLCLHTSAQQARPDTVSWRSLQDVVVTGQYAPQSVKNSVYRVRTINRERIVLRGATDVAGVLNNELGIRLQTDYTLGETDTKVMGLGGQRVKILLDGVPLIDRDATKQSLSQIDINTIERIELVEGPMSVIYGTDALAGVINIITKKGKSGDGFSVNARMQEETTGSRYSPFSKDGIHNENINLNWQRKVWHIAAWGTRNNFGGWNDTAPYPAKTWKPKKQWMTGGTLGYRFKHLHAWYRLDYLDEELFAAGVMFTTTYSGLDKYYTTNRYTHQAQADWSVGSSLSINTAISYQDYKRSTESYTIDYRAGSKTPAQGDGFWDVSEFKTFFVRSTAQWRISPAVSVQPGVEFKSYKTSGERISGTPAINDFSLFASAELKPTSRLLIKPGVRFSNNSVYDAPPLIPSLNTKFIINDHLDLRLSYARGFRAPILRELYFFFHDASHSIEGNPNLKAEYSNSFIGSLSWQPVKSKEIHLTSSVAGFYNDYHDFIDMAFDPARQVNTYFNNTRYKTIGSTLENTLQWKQLGATLGFSYIGYYNAYAGDPSRKGDRSEFAWAPEVNSNITYHIISWKTQVGLFYKFNGALPTYLLNANGDILLSKMDAYHWADLTVTQKLGKYLSLQAGAKNLFNEKRVQSTAGNGAAHSSGGPVQTGYGTSFFAGINFQWSKH